MLVYQLDWLPGKSSSACTAKAYLIKVASGSNIRQVDGTVSGA